MQKRGGIDLREALIDGTALFQQKRGGTVGWTKRGEGSRIMAMADAVGLPVSVCLASASSPHEVKLAEATLDSLMNLSVTKRMTTTISMRSL